MIDERDMTARVRSYRDELRAWLDSHRPEQRFQVSLEQAIFGGIPGIEHWADQVYRAGYMCLSWPIEYGGRGLSPLEVAITSEEFARAGLPRPTRGLGETLVGPSLLAWGTDEQKAKFLPPIAAGIDRYCQGFSESDAGSDLAGLSTKGLVDGNEIVVTGNKVWTSCWKGANMLFCLCRTNPEVPPHRGLSFVLLPMSDDDGSPNGVEVRPIRQATGGDEFAETFLSAARAPLSNVVGGLDNGWRVSLTTLEAERAGATTQYLLFLKQFWESVDIAKSRGLLSDMRTRQELARAFTAVELVRFRGLQQLVEMSKDSVPENVGVLDKILWSEHAREFSHRIVNYRGPGGMLADQEDPSEYGMNGVVTNFLFAPGLTIAGGTSEILRTVLAERILGLPKEPR